MDDLVQNLVDSFGCNVWECLYYTFSYTTLLALHYGDQVQRTWAAWDFAKENNMSIREAECQIDIGLFLDEYSQWGLGTPQQSVILHEMFLHTTERGWKEAECMVHWGCWGSVYDSDSELDQSAMELVGYNTSKKEIRDIYQSVYLLWRAPGLPLAEPTKEKGHPGYTFFSERLTA